MSKAIKIILILLIVGIAGAIVYFLMFANVEPSTQGSPLQTTTGQNVSGLAAQSTPEVNADQIGQEFLAQLLNIKTIKLREDIFSSPTFISLKDFTIELIQPGNEGRVNPFAPFGIDANVAADAQLGNVQDGFETFSDTETTPGTVGPGSVTPVNPTPPTIDISNS